MEYQYRLYTRIIGTSYGVIYAPDDETAMSKLDDIVREKHRNTARGSMKLKIGRYRCQNKLGRVIGQVDK